jgi:intraflagellar transport protein 122
MLYGISFSIVHAIHVENYACRQGLMDVTIQNLSSNKKIKVKCKRYIKKIAIYKDNLAVLCNDRVCIYKFTDEETSKLPKFIIKWDTDCNILLVTSFHFVVCTENRILLYTQANNSVLEKEWSFDSSIKYIKVVGGASKREALVAGLRNGEIFMIYIDNQFPVLIYTHDVPIRSLDVSFTRKKVKK